MNAATLRILIEKGLSPEDILAVAEAMESKKDNTNAERQARYRERRKQGKVTRNSNGVTPLKESIQNPRPDISPDGESQTERAPSQCDEIADRWNAVAKPLGLSVCSKMDGKRRRACQARLKADGFEAIVLAIEHIPKSAFLRGETGNWSGANIDFLLRPGSVTAILEGKYDDRGKQHSQFSRPAIMDIGRSVAADLEREASARAGY